MPRARLANDDVTLRAVDPSDIEAIRHWRNAQMDVLRQTAPITADQQTRYFATEVWPEKCKLKPAQIVLAIEYNDALVGYGGVVHISWPNRRAEVSFLLMPAFENDAATRASIFGKFLSLIKELAFEDLQLHRLFTETYAQRAQHIATLEAAGFLLEGCMREHALIDGVHSDALIHGCLATER
jgi:RimJ/RimL family protein N-acetyltransferase